MEKKKLKKLSLQKEEVVNLYDYEMNSIKGGTSPLTTSSGFCISLISDATSIILSYIYNEIKDYYDSKNRTQTNEEGNFTGRTSDVYLDTVCSLPEYELICS